MTVPSQSVLEVSGLRVEFGTHGGVVKAVRGVSFSLAPGKTLAIVGESGCGKSVTVQAVMGLVPTPPGRITAGSVRFLGKELVGLGPAQANRIRGKDIGMIFQDPMASLNPTMKVGKQITETLRLHQGLSREAAREKAIEFLERGGREILAGLKRAGLDARDGDALNAFTRVGRGVERHGGGGRGRGGRGGRALHGGSSPQQRPEATS